MLGPKSTLEQILSQHHLLIVKNVEKNNHNSAKAQVLLQSHIQDHFLYQNRVVPRVLCREIKITVDIDYVFT
jgi:hypothetical protein